MKPSKLRQRGHAVRLAASHDFDLTAAIPQCGTQGEDLSDRAAELPPDGGNCQQDPHQLKP
jgi:hypothetical protein